MSRAVLLSCVLLIGGCVTEPAGTTASASNIQWQIQSEINPELKDSIDQFWQTRLSRQWDRSYQLEAQSIKRRISLELYRLYHNGGWTLKSARIVSIQPEENSGDHQIMAVTLVGHYTSPKGEDKTRWIKDYWLKENGKWRHILYDPLIFPFTKNLIKPGGK